MVCFQSWKTSRNCRCLVRTIVQSNEIKVANPTFISGTLTETEAVERQRALETMTAEERAYLKQWLKEPKGLETTVMDYQQRDSPAVFIAYWLSACFRVINHSGVDLWVTVKGSDTETCVPNGTSKRFHLAGERRLFAHLNDRKGHFTIRYKENGRNHVLFVDCPVNSNACIPIDRMDLVD